jgi:hypothetical protein
VELTPKEILKALKQAQDKSVRGRRVHVFLHAIAAEKSGAKKTSRWIETTSTGLPR